jgi:hypothetical protein
MKRAILLLATAFLGATGCYSRRCVDDIAVYWHFSNADNTAELSCSQAGVSAVQIAVDGVVAGTFACSSLSSDGVTFVQGIALAGFEEDRSHSFQLDGLDGNGVILYSDALTFAPTGCRLNELDSTLIAATGTLTILPTFDGVSFPTCSAAGVDNFFVELLDASAAAVPNFNGVYLPCLNTSQGPAFTVEGLAFGQTYTFRTLDSTVTDNSVPGGQLVVDQVCGAQVSFGVATQAFVIDLREPAGECP